MDTTAAEKTKELPVGPFNGATFERLAQYLDHDVALYWPLKKRFVKLIGLNKKFRSVAITSVNSWHDPEEFMLCLKSFPDLLVPLADGVSPAQRVAELILAVPECFDQAEWDWPSLVATVDDDDQGLEHLTVQLQDKQTATDCLIHMWGDGTIHVHNGPHSNQLAAYDYLRSQHFALPVNGCPLVEGVDYIRKS